MFLPRYSIIAVMKDRIYLVNSWPFLVRYIQCTVFDLYSYCKQDVFPSNAGSGEHLRSCLSYRSICCMNSPTLALKCLLQVLETKVESHVNCMCKDMNDMLTAKMNTTSLQQLCSDKGLTRETSAL